jgi:hypothetical protein
MVPRLWFTTASFCLGLPSAFHESRIRMTDVGSPEITVAPTMENGSR